MGPAVSLAVAAIPEGLPVLATAAQLAAARRLSARDTVVRNPRALEALGRIDVLCADKTGTLTEGRIELQAVAVDGKSRSVEKCGIAHRRVVAAALRASCLLYTSRLLSFVLVRRRPGVLRRRSVRCRPSVQRTADTFGDSGDAVKHQPAGTSCRSRSKIQARDRDVVGQSSDGADHGRGCNPRDFERSGDHIGPHPADAGRHAEHLAAGRRTGSGGALSDRWSCSIRLKRAPPPSQ